MRNYIVLVILSLAFYKTVAQATNLAQPMVNSEAFYEEKNGLVAVEAEHFYKQSKFDKRQWYRTSKNETANAGLDADDNHSMNASNQAYIEILPDTRATHNDILIKGENFTDEAGAVGILHYKVKINNPGRYYVWARAYSTGSEDNGIHVGLNNQWPEHGKRMQWCDGKNQWTWGSKQRTKEQHCGVPNEIYLDFDTVGIHDIQFSMREDGFEFDKFILTTNPNYQPLEEGPETQQTVVKLPEVKAQKSKTNYFSRIAVAHTKNKVMAAHSFPVEGTNFYKNGKNWLAINPKEFEEARTTTTFNFESGKYDVVFVGVGENDGRSKFKVLINNKELGQYQPPLTTHLFEEGKRFNALWKKVSLQKGDTITVIAKIDSTDGKEHTRARWAGIIFAPRGTGKAIQDAPSSYIQD